MEIYDMECDILMILKISYKNNNKIIIFGSLTLAKQGNPKGSEASCNGIEQYGMWYFNNIKISYKNNNKIIIYNFISD